MVQFKATALASLAALIICAPAVAQEKKTLKITSIFASSHYQWSENLKVFSEAVTKATGGAIQFEAYHAGQISKEGVGPLNSGLADIAMIPPSYEPAKLPLSAVVELPGFYSTSCEATAKWWNIAKDGGPLNNAEYKPLGIKVLYGNVLPPYYVVTSKKKVTSLEELAGLKIRANGGAHDKTVRALGAVPVRVTQPELYDALTRGTIDGGFWPVGATRNGSLETAFHHAVLDTKTGGASIVIGMSQKAWDSLSAEHKAVVTKAAAETQQHLCSYVDKMESSEVAVLAKDHNWIFTRLSADESARWNARLSPVPAAWAKEMDSTGRPGSAMLEAFKQSPAR